MAERRRCREWPVLWKCVSVKQRSPVTESARKLLANETSSTSIFRSNFRSTTLLTVSDSNQYFYFYLDLSLKPPGRAVRNVLYVVVNRECETINTMGSKSKTQYSGWRAWFDVEVTIPVFYGQKYK